MLPLIVIIVLQAILALVFAITPYVTRRTECFGVSVNEEVQELSEIKALKRRYLLGCIVVCVLTLIPPVISMLTMGYEATTPMFIYLGCLLLTLVAIFLLYLRSHNAMKHMKAERGWEATKHIVVASTAQTTKGPSLLITILPSLLFIAAALYIGYSNYAALPDIVPIHYNIAGVADGFAPKTPFVIYFVPILQTFMLLIFTFVQIAIRRTKQQLSEADPKDSKRRSDIFRAAWSYYIAVFSALLLTGFTLMQASTFNLLSISISLYILLAVSLLAIVGAVILSVKVGQGGSRLQKGQVYTEGVDRDDDRFWKLGTIYYNPNDPAVFVEKRFGVGWTNNFARPVTWLMVGGLLVLIAGLIVASIMLSI